MLLQKEDDEVSFCTSNVSETFPFCNIDNDLIKLNNYSKLSSLYMLPSFAITYKVAGMPHLDDCGFDDNISNMVNSRYYQLNELEIITSRLDSTLLSILSLEAYFDDLELLLVTCKLPFSIIAQTEIRLKKHFAFRKMLVLMPIIFIPNLASPIVVVLHYTFRNHLSILKDKILI